MLASEPLPMCTPSAQAHHPSSLSVSVWMASTNRASPASKRSSRLALVYSGPAGSRPITTDYYQAPLPLSSQKHHGCTLCLPQRSLQFSSEHHLTRTKGWKKHPRTTLIQETPWSIVYCCTLSMAQFSASKMNLTIPAIWQKQ